MQVTYSHPLTFGMTVSLFSEKFYRVKGHFFNNCHFSKFESGVIKHVSFLEHEKNVENTSHRRVFSMTV